MNKFNFCDSILVCNLTEGMNNLTIVQVYDLISRVNDAFFMCLISTSSGSFEREFFCPIIEGIDMYL